VEVPLIIAIIYATLFLIIGIGASSLLYLFEADNFFLWIGFTYKAGIFFLMAIPLFSYWVEKKLTKKQIDKIINK